MSNDPHERFFKLLAKVLMMVVDEKRYAYYVYGVITGERGGIKPSEEMSWYQRINERICDVIRTPSYFEVAITALQEIIDGPKPVFVEFTLREPTAEEATHYTGRPGEKRYFVGTSLQDVLTYTAGGKNFGLYYFSAHRQVDEQFVRQTGTTMIDKGLDAVKKGCWGYSLSLPKK